MSWPSNDLRLVESMRHPEHISQRLKELESEWDLEQALNCLAGSVALAGLAISPRSRKALALSALAAGILVGQAALGWSPAVPLLKSMGFRRRAEIDQEKYALKALRGDFKNLPSPPAPEPRAAKA